MSRPEKSLRRNAAVCRASDVSFADAFENAPHAMALVGSDGTILHVNRALSGMLGYAADELNDSNISAITHPEDFETELEQRRHLACADIGRYQLIQRYLDKQGDTVWVRLSVSAMRTSAQIACFVVEAEAVAPPRLGTADESQGEWLHRFGDATLSAMHEIGNTLTPLMVNTELIVEQSRSEPVREFAREIFKAARRIAFTLRRLRRIEEGQPVAYLGEERMLDLRMVPPQSDERNRTADDAQGSLDSEVQPRQN